MQLAEARALTVIPGRVLHRSRILFVVPSLVLAVAGCHVPGTSSPAILPPGQNLTVAVVPGHRHRAADGGGQERAVQPAGHRGHRAGLPDRRRRLQRAGTTARPTSPPGTTPRSSTRSPRGQARAAEADHGRLRRRRGHDAGSHPAVLGHQLAAGSGGQGRGDATGPGRPALSRPFPYSIDTLATESVLQSDGVTRPTSPGGGCPRTDAQRAEETTGSAPSWPPSP